MNKKHFNPPTMNTITRPTLADTWEKLPAKTFRAEGTNIDAVLLSITSPNMTANHPALQ